MPPETNFPGKPKLTWLAPQEAWEAALQPMSPNPAMAI